MIAFTYDETDAVHDLHNRKAKTMSWAPEVIADGGGKWAGNGLRFATREEALANVLDLSYRWLAVRETRVVESTDPVNYSYHNHTLVRLENDTEAKATADRIDGYDRDDLGESPDY